jgi:FkbM family methyltransferase
MDLYHHDNPPFTNWIIEGGLLHETFVVIDVGVQGGEHPRWSLLGDHVRVYGFDPISEAIDRLQREARPNRVYRTLALGNEDGEREFYVPANTFGASFFNDGSRREADQRRGEGAPGPRTVPVAKLDTLFAAGEVPPADFIKLDTEQFELEVLRGARAYLMQSNILGLIAEASFRSTRTFPRSPLPDIMTLAADHRLSVFDLSYIRHPRAAYIDARTRAPWPAADPLHDMPPLDVGQPETIDLLSPAHAGTERLRAVLNDQEAVPRRDPANLRHARRPAGKVHGQDGLGVRSDEWFDRFRVDVERFVNVAKNWGSAIEQNGTGRCRPAQRRRDDFVSGTHAQCLEPQDQGISAGAYADAVAAPAIGSDPSLEMFDLRAENDATMIEHGFNRRDDAVALGLILDAEVEKADPDLLHRASRRLIQGCFQDHHSL